MQNCRRCTIAMFLTFFLLLGMLLTGCKSVDDAIPDTEAVRQAKQTEVAPELSADPNGTTVKDAEGEVILGNTRKADATKTTTKKAGTMKLTIGDKTFSVKLQDNETARALKDQLPLDLTMTELNGNEKYYYYSRLPSDARRVGTVHAGDVMLYGDNTLVVFYKTFDTDYAYTRIGTIENTDDLAEALGSGDVQVRWTA